MKLKTSTLPYLFLFLSLLTNSHAQAQRTVPQEFAKPNTHATKHQNFNFDDFKNKHTLPAFTKSSARISRLEAIHGKKLTTKDSAVSWLKKHTLTSRKRTPKTNVRSSGARTSATADAPPILYVNHNATGSGDGTSWENAFNELADALFYAKDQTGIQEIWVANGTYYPFYDHNYLGEEDEHNLRDNVFLMLPNIKMYGGFKGTETSVAERTLKLGAYSITADEDDDNYATILSGDVFDPEDDGTNVNNAYHVVLAAGPVGSASLDGFRIVDAFGSKDEDDEDAITVNGEEIPRNFGGAIAAVNSSPSLTNLFFLFNNGVYGSAIYGSQSNFVLTNALFGSNNSGGSGTIYLDKSSPVITNATLTHNTAGVSGGGIFMTGVGTAANIRNTIVYGNQANDFPGIFIGEDATASFEYSIIEGSGGSTGWNLDSGTDLGHNLDEEPFFQGNLPSLQPVSPGINAGNNLYFQTGQIPDLSAITTDQRGVPRFVGGITDIGALESLYGSLASDLTPNEDGILFVKQNGSGTRTGDSWDNAAAEVADALYAAAIDINVLDIWVAGGKYLPLYRPDDLSKVPGGQYNSFLLVDGVGVYGGFAGDEETLDQRDLSIAANASILSGDFNGDDDFNFDSFAANHDFDLKNSDNAYRVVTMVEMHNFFTTFSAFTIESGNNKDGNLRNSISVNETDLPFDYGSGIVAAASTSFVENLLVRNNFGFSGGGMALLASPLTILNSVVYNNIDAGSGSGIAMIPSYNNSFGLLNTTVARNLSLGNGPAVHVRFGDVFLINTIIYDNILSDTGPDENGDDPEPDFKAEFVYGGIVSSIIGGSGGSYNWKLFNDKFNNIIQDGGGNLDEDPGFTNSATNDFSLIPCSPAIDAGVNFYGEGGPPVLYDAAGNPRIANDLIDIGALEFQGTRPGSATALAENGEESSFVFEDGQPHTFSVSSEVCDSDILTLRPEVLAGSVTAKVWVDEQVNSYSDAFYLQRHFDITPAEHAEESLGRVFLYFTQAEFDALNLKLDEEAYLPIGDPDTDDDRIANLRIYQFHGPSSDGSGSPASYDGSRQVIDPEDSDIIWNVGMNRWEVSFNVAGFSGFFGGTASQNPLPVRLVSFEGKRTDDQKIKLDWKVAEQEGIEVYQVEYSSNGKAFNKIGLVTANALASTDYSFTDSLAHAGVNAYYRLKIVEIDKKIAYSRMITVKLPAVEGMVAYPVPAKNELWIDWKQTDAASVDFIDSNGRTLKTVKKLSSSQKIDISALPTGILILKAGQNNVLKVVKE